jgi:hypothetical protein
LNNPAILKEVEALRARVERVEAWCERLAAWIQAQDPGSRVRRPPLLGPGGRRRSASTGGSPPSGRASRPE